MPARRLYASRGVVRRATTRKSGNRFSAPGLLSLLALLVIVGTAGLMVFGACSPAAPIALPTASSRDVSALPPAMLQMSGVSAAATAPVSPAAAGELPAASATSEPLLRRWDARAPGIAIDPALVRELDRALIGVNGSIGLAVKDLGSGRGAVLDGDLELQSASLYKLPVLYTVFASGLSMGESLPITDDALSYDTGTMELGPGEALTVAEALERMITLSDNTSAVMLGGRVGAGRINATLAGLGMDTTHYSLERMTTSALDMLHLVELVADGKAVSPSASAEMVHLLLRQRVNDRLPKLLPLTVHVAHKTGNLPGTVNDVGVLYGPSSTVAVAALVSDTADEAAATAAIARVALGAYSYFEEQPEVANRPLIPPMPSRPIPPVWREPRPPTPTPEPTEEPTAIPTATALPAATAVAARPATPTPPRPTAAPTSAPVVAAPTRTPEPPPATPTPAAKATQRPAAPTATAAPNRR